jgi:adenosine deaminase
MAATHLHVHLEPNERKRRQLKESRSAYRSADQFFAEHDPACTERLSIDLHDLDSFINDFHAEQRDQAIDYAELRLSPRRFHLLGFPLPDVLRSADRAVSNLTEPTIRLILLINRDSSPRYIDECVNAVSNGLPGNFAGIDLAGNEKEFPSVARFTKLFHKARETGLGTTVHAGEFGDQDSVWRAIDQLGAERIGHGVSAAYSDALAARLRSDQILLEVSLTSNVALGAVPTLESHPLPWFVEHDIPVCLNTDIPLHLGTDMHTEQQAAGQILSTYPQVLQMMEASAQAMSFRDRSFKSAPG